MVRQGFYEEELGNVEEFCKKNKLACVKSGFKVRMLDENLSFSNKGIKIPADDPGRGMFFVYMSKDELSAYKSAYYESAGDNMGLGASLGYPECCCSFYSKHFPERSVLDNNYETPVLENSEGDSFRFYTNIFVRHKDYCLIPHFPCSLDCSESIRLGKLALDLLGRADSRLAIKFEENLKGEVRKNSRRIKFS